MLVHTKFLKHVGKVEYESDLPNELAMVHSVFHFSMPKKCINDPVSIIPLKVLEVYEGLFQEEVPIEKFDQQVKRSIIKEVDSIKVI